MLHYETMATAIGAIGGAADAEGRALRNARKLKRAAESRARVRAHPGPGLSSCEPLAGGKG